MLYGNLRQISELTMVKANNLRKTHTFQQKTRFLKDFLKKVEKKFGSFTKSYYLCIAIQKSLN